MLGAKQDIVDINEWRVHPSAQIHPQAHIQAGVTIGAGTRVWQFASVIRNSWIGRNCSIASNSIVDGSILGANCIVSHGAFIDPGMFIATDVFIGPHVSLCNDFWPRTDKMGWFDIKELISGQKTVTTIKSRASIGANAIVMPGVTIGVNAMVAAGATVTADVPDDHLWKRDGTVAPIDRQPNRMRTC